MKSFKLNARALERLFAVWNLPLPETGLVLFALRGSRPRKPSPGWTPSATLELVPVDHVHLRCTLGIWDRKNGRVFAAPGSTVPHRDNVLKAARRRGAMQGRGTNQMEPGLYPDLRKGEHLQGKPSGHAALRQTGYRFYRRSHHAPPYTRQDPLFFGNPYDNLHCAWNPDGRAPGYRSSGCLVVAGTPHCPRLPDSSPNLGPWKTFHDFLYAARQNGFPLLLLPAGEAATALAGSGKSPRLCFGSRGKPVRALQQRLRMRGLYAGPLDGILGPATYRAWNRVGLSGFGKLLPG